MKKTIFISAMICSIIFCLAACININPVKNLSGNGILKEQDRGIMDFEAIDARGSVDVIISESTDAPIKISGDENLIEYIETYVKNGVLKIQFKNRDYLSYSTRLGIKVTIPNNGRINSIKTSGSTNVIIEGTIVADNMSITGKGSSEFNGNIKAEKCKIDCSGSSDFKVNIEATTCILRFAGSSSCNISGNADVCEMTVTGSGDFKGYDFVVDKLTCSVFGSSGVQVTCNEELNIRTFGSSDVSYRGSATKISKSTAGSSSVINR